MLTRYSQSFDYYLSRCSLYILTYAQSVVDYILIVSFQNVKELRTLTVLGGEWDRTLDLLRAKQAL